MTVYKNLLRKLANSVGYEIKALDSLENVRVLTARLLRGYGVDLILDVGANSGQYARYLRDDIGYSGQIVSFEPQSAAFESLAENAKGDPLWRTINVGLGNVVERRRINIAGNSLSSSFLNMLPAHELAAPASRYVSQEDVDVVTLDSIFQTLCSGTERVFLKIDAQGFERNILDGAEEVLAHIPTVQMELSLVALYEGQATFLELTQSMMTKGYRIIGIHPEFGDLNSGELLQVDAVFRRT